MSIYIEQKYLNILSGQLERFTRKRDDLYNFRCPICGDSQKKKHKARGYVYRKDNYLFYRCHNCSASMSLGNFIKEINPSLHQQYIMENYSGNTSSYAPVEKPEFKFKPPKFLDNSLQKIDSVYHLSDDHYCKQYVVDRGIPKKHYKNLYFTENFKEWVADIEKSEDDIYKHLYEEPRLVIPFFDRSRKMIAAQGRALGQSDLRYITIKIDDHHPKIFGVDRIDKSKPIFVVEGPIDSLFIENCIAVAGGDLVSALSHLTDCELIFVYDNERRNRETVKKMEATIERQHKIVIWPQYVREKDINDMVLGGINVPYVLDSNIYHGLTAKTKMLEFKI
jgi:hypothetical protein